MIGQLWWWGNLALFHFCNRCTMYDVVCGFPTHNATRVLFSGLLTYMLIATHGDDDGVQVPISVA